MASYPLTRRLARMLGLLNGYALMLARRTKFYLSYLETKKRLDEAEQLAAFAGVAFKRATLDFSKVGYTLMHGPGYGIKTNGEQLPICSEAPFTVCIYLGETLAFAMCLSLSESVVHVRQLQGVRGVRPPSGLSHWPRMLVGACMTYAKVNGVRSVRLYRADQSLFFRYPERPPMEREEGERWMKEHQRRMRTRYDGTARKLGFKMKRRYGEWINPDFARS